MNHKFKHYRPVSKDLSAPHHMSMQVLMKGLKEWITAATPICCEFTYVRQNGRRMISFWGAMAKLGAGVDNELGGSDQHQCR